LGLILPAIVWIGIACRSSSPDDVHYGGELIFRGERPALGFDPPLVRHILDYMIAFQVFDGLLQYSPETFQLRPALAERWETPDGGQTWIFHLRRGVRFHDDACFPDGRGREVRAEDVVYSMARVVKWQEDPFTWLAFRNIEGVEDYREGRTPTLKGLQALDPYTVKIVLKRPSYLFPHKLAGPRGWVVPWEAVEFYGDAFRNHPVGTGPFRLVKWDPASGIYMVRNPHYWERDEKGRPLPYLSSLRGIFVPIALVEASWPTYQGKNWGFFKIDAAEFYERFNFQGKDRPQLLKVPIANTIFFRFNFAASNPFAKNRLLRQAVAYAFRRKIFCPDSTYLARGLLPPGIPGYDPSLRGYTFDLEKARDLLKKAGFPNGEGLPPLRCYWTNAPLWQIQKVKQDLAQIGIVLELITQPVPLHFSGVFNREFDFFRDGWIADFPDPLNFLQLFYSRSPFNSSNYQNPEYDALFEQAEVEPDSLKRIRLVQRMEAILLEDCPAIFIHHEWESIAIHPSLKNAEKAFNPYRMRFYKYIWIKE